MWQALIGPVSNLVGTFLKNKAAEKQALIDVKNIVVDLSIAASQECLTNEIDQKKSNDLILESSKNLTI